MECTRYRESIQDLIDGTIGPIRRAELERHLAGCADCRALVADLETIRDAAASLDPLEPPARVWLQIAGRLRQEGRVAAPPAPPCGDAAAPALLAIAAALILAVGASIVMLLPACRTGAVPHQLQAAAATRPGPGQRARRTPPSKMLRASSGWPSSTTRTRLRNWNRRHGSIRHGGRTATGDRRRSIPQTAAMLQKNLHVIDQAIAESRAALRTEPLSAPARDSLFDALKRKVALLQDTIALMNEMRKGNAAGAAQIIEGASKS